jgi:putative SOS response-associated peptidase YedK
MNYRGYPILEPHYVMAPIHDRMPAVIDTAHLDTWMNVASTELEPMRSMLAPAPELELPRFGGRCWACGQLSVC